MSITWICHSKRLFNTSPPHLFWYLCWFSLHQRFLLYTTTLYVYHSVKLGGKEDQKKKKKKEQDIIIYAVHHTMRTTIR